MKGSAENAKFWDGCAAGELMLPRCRVCGTFAHYPTPVCRTCSATEFVWEPVAGRGVVHSFTWVHRPAPGFEGLEPYALALVELDEGPLLMSQIVNMREGQLVIGIPVRVMYETVGSRQSAPVFIPC